jgi:hypothetical protein
MKAHSRLRSHAWILLAGMVMLIAGHGIVLYYISSHLVLSGAIVTGVLALVVIKHFGWLVRLHTVYRRRSRRSAR